MTSAAREVLVHYHLFKNGGTSIEKLLRASLGEGWQSYDKDEPGAKISGSEMQAWIEKRPAVRAVSSHQLVPPEPVGPFHVTPVVFLRDPLARVRSAYLFEWQKQPALAEPKGTLSNYIEEKFKQQNTSVIANFQVSRLSNTDYHGTQQRLHRYNETLLPSAIGFIDRLPFIGIVERFGDSIRLMRSVLADRFPDMVFQEYQENVTQRAEDPAVPQAERLRKEIGNELFDELCVRNRLDLQLYSYARGRFKAALDNLGEAAVDP